MKRYMIRLIVLGCLFWASCHRPQNTDLSSNTADSSIPVPTITVLADLTDSSQPRIKAFTNISTVRIAPRVKPVVHSFVNPETGVTIPWEAQGRGLFTTYTTDDGLGLDQINCSYRDRKGNIWLGTNGGGISRYDGQSFTNFTTSQGLAYNLVWCIKEDKAGNIWIGTDGGGVSCYDGTYFKNYTTRQGLTHNVVSSIQTDKQGNLWFGTYGGGVSKFNGKTFENYTVEQGLSNNYISGIEEGDNGELWFSTRGGGFCRLKNDVFTKYSTTNGLIDDVVRCMYKDKRGFFWFGTNKGLSKWNGDRFENFTKEDGLADNTIFRISEDQLSRIWLATSKGVSQFDGKRFLNYSTDQGLANNRVTSITEDQQGNMWFSTFGGGVSRFAGTAMTNFTSAQGMANNVVYSITEDADRNIWMGTNGGGASKYDGRTFTHFTKAQGLVSDEIYCILHDSKGNLWFGSSNAGMSKWDGRQFTTFNTSNGLSNNTIFRLQEDSKGDIWIGSSGGGVSKFDGKTFTHYTTRQGLAGNVVFTILEDREGSLWFGTLGGGVSRFDGKSFTNFTRAQGLADNSVWSIHQDEAGDIWLGTQDGLSWLKKEKITELKMKMGKQSLKRGPLFETFTTREGLPHNFVTQVIGGGNKMFIGTNNGFCELLPLMGKPETKSWRVGKLYHSTTGYPVKDVNSGQGAMYKDSKGIFWIGTGSDKTGLVRFDPGSLDSTVSPPMTLQIKSIQLNNEVIAWRDLEAGKKTPLADSVFLAGLTAEEIGSFGRLLTEDERDSMRSKFSKVDFSSISAWYPVPENLILPYQNNSIGFQFNAIETGENHLVNYQYKLEGYSKQWSPAGTGSTASFGNMYEGNYTFLLKAQSPKGIWTTPISYHFKVLPPWWRTWWAYTLMALLFLWALRLFSLYRERRLRFERDKLEVQVKHRTQMLENTIDTLKNTQAQLVQSEKMALLGELTSGIAHEIQNPLNFVNNFSEVNKELLAEMREEIDKGNLREIKDISDDVLQNLEKIHHHGQRAGAIVKGMLQHTRASNGQKEWTDINALAHEYLKVAQHVVTEKEKDFHVLVETSFDPLLQKVFIVPQDIGRVLMNLYTNAFYALSAQRKQLGSIYEPVISVSTQRTDLGMEIRVKDNGIGIPDTLKQKIFQPFFTTKPSGQGTGLGLSMSYDIIKSNGGTLEVDSMPGVFTKFVVVVPLES
jgi:signal transduction histidine kinase/ligand-binding sensor domain-containing protein